MKRPSTIRLAMMGGGAVLAIGAGAALLSGDSDECRRARALAGPDAAAACGGGSGGRSSSGSSATTASYASGGDSASSSTSRGGFGASAHGSSAS